MCIMTTTFGCKGCAIGLFMQTSTLTLIFQNYNETVDTTDIVSIDF